MAEVFNVVNDGKDFGRLYNLDLLIAQGLMPHIKESLKERLDKALSKAKALTPSLFDYSSYNILQNDLKKLAFRKDSSKLKVVGAVIAKGNDNNLSNKQKQGVLNEQVLVNLANKSKDGPSLTLGRNA